MPHLKIAQYIALSRQEHRPIA